jgi:hypothetical protein
MGELCDAGVRPSERSFKERANARDAEQARVLHRPVSGERAKSGLASRQPQAPEEECLDIYDFIVDLRTTMCERAY